MFVIMPPKALSDKIHEERIAFAERYGFVKALKPPVHTTLYPPFNIVVEQNNAFEEKMHSFNDWAKQFSPFTIELKDFNFFENNRSPVIYIDVLKNKELSKLHSAFSEQLHKLTGMDIYEKFNPHFTIGYRDIAPKAFPAIKEYYQQHRFSADFLCEGFYLWKHDGKNWQVNQAYQFRSENV